MANVGGALLVGKEYDVVIRVDARDTIDFKRDEDFLTSGILRGLTFEESSDGFYIFREPTEQQHDGQTTGRRLFLQKGWIERMREQYLPITDLPVAEPPPPILPAEATTDPDYTSDDGCEPCHESGSGEA